MTSHQCLSIASPLIALPFPRPASVAFLSLCLRLLFQRGSILLGSTQCHFAPERLIAVPLHARINAMQLRSESWHFHAYAYQFEDVHSLCNVSRNHALATITQIMSVPIFQPRIPQNIVILGPFSIDIFFIQAIRDDSAIVIRLYD